MERLLEIALEKMGRWGPNEGCAERRWASFDAGALAPALGPSGSRLGRRSPRCARCGRIVVSQRCVGWGAARSRGSIGTGHSGPMPECPFSFGNCTSQGLEISIWVAEVPLAQVGCLHSYSIANLTSELYFVWSKLLTFNNSDFGFPAARWRQGPRIPLFSLRR